ncbi:hypothetical protein K488DRAFT_89187 [Vararia minispora EC-137]|uniref:Uncharacterized protein n=1 Tax=Vararia minispora EC-137 TaxID=1314806 RepID=A0ACB8QBJ1_9AGAM|nr:hypothetical protein K488DRAFT_89187 [Vararia minispora EC-137]
MAAIGSAPPLANTVAIAERTEIHKSCRALEAVVSVLSDYAEAARAVATLQKKLIKALREAAALKAAGEIAGNAFVTSAGIFEAIYEIDTKFAKIADKECDMISGEVRKWFKKLSKEEKVHDDKIATANTRIKQAGMAYEKRAKKNVYDAAEEHTRYIALLSSLGPEITQEKYNHQLAVSQRNTTMTYGVAATVARIADAEWLRATEGVRRFAPLIGQVGEWRSLCEGGWAAAVPEPLPDVDVPSTAQPPSGNATVPPYIAPPDVLANPALRPATERRSSATETAKSEQAADDQRRPTSLTNLASFPSPPAHFPLPPVNSPSKAGSPVEPPPARQLTASPAKMTSLQTPQSRTASLDGSPAPRAEGEGPDRELTPALTEDSRSPASTTTPLTPANIVSSLLPSSPEPDDQLPSTQTQARTSTPLPTAGPSLPSKPTDQARLERAAPSLVSVPSSSRSSASGSTTAFRRGDYVDERDFAPAVDKDKARSLDSPGGARRGAVERTDSVKSTGSVVAQMKDRYSRSTGPASPPPRDVPRLPLSVTEMASKFQAPVEAGKRQAASPVQEGFPIRKQEGALAGQREDRPTRVQEELLPPSRQDDVPRRRSYDALPTPSARDRRSYDASDTAQRSRSPGDPPTASRQPHNHTESSTASGAASRPVSMYMDDLERRRQRVFELEELERRERELEERARERRRREDTRRDGETAGGLGRLREEDESGRFDSYHSAARSPARPGRSPEPYHDGYSSDVGRPHTARPLSQASGTLQPPSLTSRYSYSTTNLAVTAPRSPQRTTSDQPLQFPSQGGGGVPTHPGNCQCPACTVERAANGLGPPAPERERKVSGWRRRLSMPVIIPFTGEGKKVERGIQGGKPIGHQSNSSVTSFGRR